METRRNAELRTIESVWGHLAGVGANPPDNEFVDAALNGLLSGLTLRPASDEYAERRTNRHYGAGRRCRWVYGEVRRPSVADPVAADETAHICEMTSTS